MSEQNQFDWVDFYKELSGKLLQYKDNREELIEKVRKIYEITGINLPTLEKDNQIIDIDPFTFFGLFNNEYQMMGNRICVRTLDLSGDFKSIKKQLDEIAEKYLLVKAA